MSKEERKSKKEKKAAVNGVELVVYENKRAKIKEEKRKSLGRGAGERSTASSVSRRHCSIFFLHSVLKYGVFYRRKKKGLK